MLCFDARRVLSLVHPKSDTHPQLARPRFAELLLSICNVAESTNVQRSSLYKFLDVRPGSEIWRYAVAQLLSAVSCSLHRPKVA